ncbi:MAG: PorP/SprF family type IX secretion system membrane protein [Bacteroidota bacterium]
MKKFLPFILWLGISGISLHVFSQDNQSFYQYTFQGSSFNPAEVGLNQGFSAQLANRQEFSQLPGSPQTLLLAGQYRLPSSPVGLGLLLTNDKIGYERRLSVGAQLGFHLIDEEDQKLGLGVSLGYWSLNADYTQARTSELETGLGNSLSFNQGVLDANLGFHYFQKRASGSLFVDVATQNLPAALLSYADRIDPYGLEIPAQLITSARYRIFASEQISIEPGVLLRLHFNNSSVPIQESYAIFKPGNAFLHVRAYADLGEVGQLWLGGGSTLAGVPTLGFGVSFNQLGIELYGVGGPQQYLGFSHEEGILYKTPLPAKAAEVNCVADQLNRIAPTLTSSKLRFPENTTYAGASYRGNALILPFTYPDYSWETYRMSALPKQGSLVDYVSKFSQNLVACDEITPPARFRVQVALQVEASSLSGPSEGEYQGAPFKVSYLLGEAGEKKEVEITRGYLTQEQILALKLHEIKARIRQNIPSNTAVDLYIIPGQQSQKDAQQITLQIEVNRPNLN